MRGTGLQPLRSSLWGEQVISYVGSGHLPTRRPIPGVSRMFPADDAPLSALHPPHPTPTPTPTPTRLHRRDEITGDDSDLVHEMQSLDGGRAHGEDSAVRKGSDGRSRQLTPKIGRAHV